MSEYAAEFESLAKSLAKADLSTDGGFSSSLWKQLVELGLREVYLPDSAGASHGMIEDLASLVRTLSRFGLVSPLPLAAVAAWATAEITEAQGRNLTACILRDPVQVGDGRLTAQLMNVPWGDTADGLLLIPEGGVDGAILVELDPSSACSPGALDPFVHLSLSDARCVRVTQLAPDIRSRLELATLAALMGFVDSVMIQTQLHVSTRHQFGRPLDSLPAVSAALARASIAVLRADLLLGRAVDGVKDEKVEAQPHLQLATRIVVAEAATLVCAIAHQLHGAIGTTSEHSLHRLTSQIWAFRDWPSSELMALRTLGEISSTCGEESLWNDLTPARFDPPGRSQPEG